MTKEPPPRVSAGQTDPAALAITHAAAWPQDPWSGETFARFLARKATLLTGDARAFVLGQVVADEAEIIMLATHPDHRRQGLARDALHLFLREAEARGATEAFLDVAADNAQALALYIGAGFRRVGRRAGYYPGGVDALLLRRGQDVPPLPEI